MFSKKAPLMNFKKSHVVAILGVTVLASAIVLDSRSQQVTSIEATQAHSQNLQMQQSVTFNGEPSNIVQKFVTGTEYLPASLLGTEVAGELSEDVNGNLIVTRGVRDVFDYFLTATGEESTQVLVNRIKAYVHSRLRERAALQAIDLLTQYMAYKDQIASAINGQIGESLVDVKARRDAIQQLRRASFKSTTYDAFFGIEDLIDNYSVDRFALLQDKSLSAQAMATKLAAAREKLPASVREAMGATEIVQTLNEVTSQLNQRGGTSEELRAVRETLVGVEAANRLDVMDQEDARWQRRADAYLAKRESIRADESLSDGARRDQLKQMRAGFSPNENVRLDALETIHDIGERHSGQR